MTKHTHALTHAKIAQPFIHAPLFRSFEKGQQEELKLDITYVVEATGVKFRFWGPEPLGATDLRVLQGLVAVTTRQLSVPDGVSNMLRDGRSQRTKLRLLGDVLTSDVIAARFKLYSFARELGYASPSAQTLHRLLTSIKRLSAITVELSTPVSEGLFHILSGYVRDKATDEVVVGLNPSLTAAVLGKSDFLRVDFDEVRKLKGEVARLLHARLHWINPGTRRAVNLDTLCAYVYADAPPTANAEKLRKKTVHKALKELHERLDWGVEGPTTQGLFTVQRPKPKRPPPRTENTDFSDPK